jgi:hypothetical protein
MKTPIKILSAVAIATTVLQTTIAQANLAPMVERSDTIFQQWEVVRNNFGCAAPPRSPDANSRFTRYEMAVMVHFCHDRIGQLVENSQVVGGSLSTDDLKALDPLIAELAVETATLNERMKDPNYDPSVLLRKPKPRPIANWIMPKLKTLGQSYQCPSLGTQIRNPADLRTSRYDVASTIQVCIDRTQKHHIAMQKTDAEDFQTIQTEFEDELAWMRDGGFCDFP